jgi:hypothetical protein
MSSASFNERVASLSLRVQEMNDESLIKPDEAPNANTIYHIYNDGEITEQKGGHAYGMRNVRTWYGPIIRAESLPLRFKNERKDIYGVSVSYSIVTDEQALKIREEIKALVRDMA